MAAIPNKRYIPPYIRNAGSSIVKRTHVENKNIIEGITGANQSFFIFLLARSPTEIENIGFTAKNRINMYAIPASDFTTFTTANGIMNITTILAIEIKINSRFTFMSASFLSYQI